MTKSVSDKLLQGLYIHNLQNAGYMARITEIIPNVWNWRGIAQDLYQMGLIVFNPGSSVGACAKLTDNGVKFCETTSFIDPSTPVIELEDL